ncbi:MAG: crcB 2 [Gammaproteobacteria bacterium]|jgi:CrcB protein|nr:crcB 2 [Gammaproteobacteria bacterium]
MSSHTKFSLLIFFGCGIGGLFRYWISNIAYLILGRSFPFGTLIVNVSGSFLAGLLLTLVLERYDGAGPQLRAFLLIGFLGGYTTFSSFSVETVALIETGKWLSACMNIFLSTTLCVSVAWLGIVLGRILWT